MESFYAAVNGRDLEQALRPGATPSTRAVLRVAGRARQVAKEGGRSRTESSRTVRGDGRWFHPLILYFGRCKVVIGDQSPWLRERMDGVIRRRDGGSRLICTRRNQWESLDRVKCGSDRTTYNNWIKMLIYIYIYYV